MEESKPCYVREKLSNRSNATRTARQHAIAARQTLYAATKGIDNILKIYTQPKELEAALKPFLAAAAILAARPDSGK